MKLNYNSIFEVDFLITSPHFLTPSHSCIKPLYVRELDNIFINNLNQQLQIKQREDNEQFTKVSHGPFWNFCITGHRREDQELG